MCNTHPTDAAEAIDAVLAAFTEGAAVRDLDRVRRALHPESRVFVPRPDGMQIIDRDAYLGLMEAGKVGGTPADRRLLQIEVDRAAASARQVRDMGAVALHDAVSLVRGPEGWMIACLVVQRVASADA